MSDIILKFSLSGCKNIHFAIITKKYKCGKKQIVISVNNWFENEVSGNFKKPYLQGISAE
jgi:hypothetical protein